MSENVEQNIGGWLVTGFDLQPGICAHSMYVLQLLHIYCPNSEIDWDCGWKIGGLTYNRENKVMIVNSTNHKYS